MNTEENIDKPVPPKNLSLIMAANVLLSVGLTFGHASKSRVFLNWKFLIDFDGDQPFQSRVLIFLIANAISRIHPLSNRSISLLFESIDLFSVIVSFIFMWKAWVALGSKRGSLLILYFLFWWQLFATFVVSSYNNYYYPYDMLSVAFMSMAVWMIVSGQALPALLALTTVAMLNRETAVVIPFFYLAFNWPATRRVWREFAVLLAVCVIIKIGISIAQNVTTDMVSLEHVPGFPRIYYNFAFLWLGPEYRGTLNAFFAFGFAWILLLMPGRADHRLRNMMWCFVPYLLGMMFVGNLSEIRIFVEFVPLLTLLLTNKVTVRDS